MAEKQILAGENQFHFYSITQAEINTYANTVFAEGFGTAFAIEGKDGL
jgi:hypothetical protein